MLLSKVFYFDAAHFLKDYPGKCSKLHGHTYRLEVVIEGEPDEKGMVKDFARVGAIVKEKLLSELDHSSLNDLIPNPTCEQIALFIWQKLAPHLNLYYLRLWEGKDNSVILRREDIKQNRLKE